MIENIKARPVKPLEQEKIKII
jgi:hypothetical protein